MFRLFNLLPQKVRLVIAWLLDEVVVPFLPEKSKDKDDNENSDSDLPGWPHAGL